MAPDRNRAARAHHVHQFSVATYNVHSCVGMDRRCDPARVAEVIRELDADIVALQEVDSRRCWRDRHPFDQFEYLAEATGMEPLPGQNIVTHRGCFGNVLLTRLPVCGFKRRDISVDRREPRGVIAAHIDAGPHRLNVIATHLGVSLRERRRQVAKLMDMVEAGLDAADGLVLLGDLNEWRRTGGSLAPLAVKLRPAPALASFPGWRPILPLDRIFVAGRIRVHSVKAHRSRLAWLASDHLPVRAEMEWSAKPAAELKPAPSVAMDDESLAHRE